VISGVAHAQSTINWNTVDQEIDGFGASSAWNPTLTSAQADMFFSVTNGIGLSLLRNRIAPDGTTEELVPMQEAQARGATVWSTPWSPPAAYKSNDSVINGGSLLTADYADYANQLATYVVNMKNAGVNIYAVSIQNEPDVAIPYESCLWTAQNFHDFIPYLHAALAAQGVASTKILLAEESTWSFDLTTTATSDPTTEAMIGILAAHGYDSSAYPVSTGSGQHLWETEVSNFAPYDGSINDALGWAVTIHNFLTVAQVNAWNYWWLISANPDNEGLTDQSGNPAKRMYALGNFSKFVRPGYYRIGAISDPNLSVSAYRDPVAGNFAIVAINTNTTAVSTTFNFNGVNPTAVTPWITSASLSLVAQTPIAISGTSFAYTMPAQSIVSFVGQFTGLSSPIGLTICAGNGETTLNWISETDATSYNVMRSFTQNGTYVTIGNTTSTNFTDTKVVNGTTYYYEVSAVNGTNQSVSTAPVSATPEIPPYPTAAVSSITHGSAGTFNLPLALTGNPTIECRRGSTIGNYSLVLTFSQPVTSLTATLGLQAGQSGSVVGTAQTPIIVNGANGSTVTVNLTGVGDAQHLNLQLSNIQPGNGTASVPINILWGDVNGAGVVDGGDYLATRSKLNSTLNSTNFQYDVGCFGFVNGGDALLVRSLLNTYLP
jgi:glucuronoarabinoxylan endo-1,4-beta-xylanase